MHDYLLSSEWVRFAFVLGVAVSMVLYERRHLTTGSIVVPGYIAVFIIHPPVLIATFANALVTYFVVNHVLRRFFLLYGRTKFTLLALISTLIQTVLLRVSPRGEWLWESDIPLFIGVGYVVPALIAHDMARQGVWKTSKSVMLAGSLVATPIAVALVFDLPGVNELAPLDGFGNMAIAGRWLPLAVLLSVLASWGVATNFDLRSGGFVGAAFVSMFMGDPWQVVVAVVIAVLTYLIVTHVLMRHMILFGRRKFSSMLLVSSLLAWTLLWFGGRFLNEEWQLHLGLGSLALTPLLLPGLLANDAQRTAPRRVVGGVVLGGTFVLTTTWWVQSAVTGAVLHPGWKLLSIMTCGAVFAKQFEALFIRARARFGPAAPTPAEPGTTPAPTIVPAATGEHAGPIVTAGPRPTPAPAIAAARVERRGERRRSGAAPPPSPQVTPWQTWAQDHPDAAREAERWLEEQLEPAAPALVPAMAGPSGPPDRTASPGAIDDLTRSVLESALRRVRGVPRVPRRRVVSEVGPSGPPAAFPLARRPGRQISETSSGAREAHTAPLDVSAEPEPTGDDAAR